MDTDRNLLFAVLALQAGLIDRERFIQACTLWATRKEVPVADLLVVEGWLTASARDVVDHLLALNISRHGGACASLAAAAGAEARRALASLADADVGQSLAGLPAPAADPFGTVFVAEEPSGRNVFFEEIGRGGMGRVLRGRDNDLRRELAVKVLHEKYGGNADMERRFIEEAQIGGQLQHPGVVPIYELGRFPDRRPFFTMKLVEGRTLADLLKERPDPGHDLPRFLTVFEQACQTVAYAHSKGVIHRDLKPANVMVGGFGEVQVMDWGLAKVLPGRRCGREAACGPPVATAGDDRTGSAEGTGTIGTPEFMPPEQARGEAADECADVFGLGGILCVLLTGAAPFTGTRDEVSRKAPAGDLAEAFARLDGCKADRALVELCKSCLAPRREQRPRDAGEVAARVAAYGEAVQDRLRAAELERAAAQARAAAEGKARRRTRALAAAVLALVAVGAGGGLLVQYQAAGRRAEQARHEAEQRQAVEFALEKAGGLRERSRWAEAAAVLEQARRVLGGAGPDDLRRRLDEADAELRLVNRLDSIRQRRAVLVAGTNFDKRAAAEDYATAFREAGLGRVGDDEAAAAARARASGVAGSLVAALDDWASLSESEESRRWLLGVVRAADPHPLRDGFRDPGLRQNRPALLARLNEALRDNGDELSELSPQLVGSLAVLLGGEPGTPSVLRAAQRRWPNDFWLNLELSSALFRAKRVDEAIGYCRVAVALRPEVSAAHNNLGLYLRIRNDPDAAVAELRKAVDLDPGLAIAHNNYGVCLRDKRDLDGAIAEFRRAIDLDPELPQPHNNLGAALHARSDLDGAIAECRKAVRLDPNSAEAHCNLGFYLRARKDLDGAIAECRKAVDLDPGLAIAHYNYGVCLRDKRDLDGAIAEFRKAADLDPRGGTAHSGLGEVLLIRGQFREARAALRRSLELMPEQEPLRSRIAIGLEDCERWIPLDEKLPAVLRGEIGLKDGAEAAAFAHLCQYYKHSYGEAARLYDLAFAADPGLAVDLRREYRYDAACSAALAAAPAGAGKVPDKVRLMLRRQALGWLRADLALYANMAERADPDAGQMVRRRLLHWLEDSDLTSVRDRALDELPDDERHQWRQLWDDAAVLLEKVGEAK